MPDAVHANLTDFAEMRSIGAIEKSLQLFITTFFWIQYFKKTPQSSIKQQFD